MATILKCKICGGDISVNAEMTVGTCQYCGSTITLPKIDSDKKARLFNRAIQYRLNCEFDKAYDAYNAIVSEDETEAEAYWGMVLSEYGVEYVEDPATKKMIPTCHRTQIHSVQSTVNYEYACKYAEPDRKFIYQDEAEELDRIQKNILSISSKESPYDVFICYKETADNGERTTDSVIAQDIYTELEKQGLKVFFSRISLEDKLGKDYEPYIYAALKSARVMLVVGTSNQNFSSVWVKNEWSRFIAFMKDDTNKTLIPVYKDMNAYELPDELNRYQAQDLSKIGAVQDLVYSAKKLAAREEREKKDIALEGLIKDKIEREERATALKNKRAKALSGLKKAAIVIIALAAVIAAVIFVRKLYVEVLYPNHIYSKAQKQLENGDYEAAIATFASLNGYKDSEEGTNEAKYLMAMAALNENRYDDAMAILDEIDTYKDSDQVYKQCLYQKAEGILATGEITEAAELFDRLGDYSDARNRYLDCLVQLQLNDSTHQDSKTLNTTLRSLGEYSDEQLYSLAKYFYDAKDYSNGLKVLAKCGDYQDGLDMIKSLLYIKAMDFSSDQQKLVELKTLSDGSSVAELLGYDSVKAEYKYADADKTIEEIAEPIYKEGMAEYNSTNWGTAKTVLATVSQIDYKDSKQIIEKCNDNVATEKARYDGVWIESSRFWTHLKIQNGKVSYSTDKANNPNKSWKSCTSKYDEDTGALSFTYWTDAKYDVSVSGNSLSIKWTNKKDQWDDRDWFGTHNKFTRGTG